MLMRLPHSCGAAAAQSLVWRCSRLQSWNPSKTGTGF